MTMAMTMAMTIAMTMAITIAMTNYDAIKYYCRLTHLLCIRSSGFLLCFGATGLVAFRVAESESIMSVSRLLCFSLDVFVESEQLAASASSGIAEDLRMDSIFSSSC